MKPNAHQKEFKRLEDANDKQNDGIGVQSLGQHLKVMDNEPAANNLRSIMHCRGDNNYKQVHNQGEKIRTAVDLSVNYEDYIACKDILLDITRKALSKSVLSSHSPHIGRATLYQKLHQNMWNRGSIKFSDAQIALKPTIQ